MTATQFKNLLEVLGGEDIVSENSGENWQFFTVMFPTPAGEMKAGYLYLASDCPYREANRLNLATWRRIQFPYTIVTTTKSHLSKDLDKTASEFGGSRATTSRKLLVDNVLKNVRTLGKVAEDFPYFVEPQVRYNDSSLSKEKTVPALSSIVDFLVKEKSENDSFSAEILVAPAGQGKTTLCRAIGNKIRSDREDFIPVLIESKQWQQLRDLALPNI
ncbi:MAG: hypothetical protein F4160_08330 [Rhodospirillaceae bacterium]|nr:hypothetical protein [Rhodospirillaceae bacterium]MYH36792.1 hypothetical protein [Rhodospirillaceae bacterium]MYK16199.1 hypothetical protein [Rhodospirillaceae bacterium]